MKSVSFGEKRGENHVVKEEKMEGNTLRERLRNRVDDIAKVAPARLTLVIFALIIAFITALLELPISTRSGVRAPFVDAFFNAVSAVCVTGLTTVDTANYWSEFGHVVIMIGIKIGGLGIMTLASILALAVSRHIGLTQRMLAATEKSTRLGDVGSLVRAAIIASSTIEFLLVCIYFPRFLTLGKGFLESLWYAVFMAISTYNNAGFVILPEGLTPYTTDWWMGMPIILGTALGAIGFPVVLDVARYWKRPSRLTLHSKLTLSAYGLVALVTTLAVGALEWSHETSFGELPAHARIMNAMLAGVNSRSSGLTLVPTADMTESTWFVQDIMMFIGGGSASTAGGIKVTTLAVMALAIVAEARGDKNIEAFKRSIPASTVRLAVAVAAISAFLVGTATIILLVITDWSLNRVLFEVVSAFGTVGLSTGITSALPVAAKYVLAALMFAGRTGTMTVAAALALRQRRRVISMPTESPAIG